MKYSVNKNKTFDEKQTNKKAKKIRKIKHVKAKKKKQIALVKKK